MTTWIWAILLVVSIGVLVYLMKRKKGNGSNVPPSAPTPPAE